MESTFLFFLTSLFTAVMARSKNEEALHCKSVDSRRSNQKSLENGQHFFSMQLCRLPRLNPREKVKKVYSYTFDWNTFFSQSYNLIWRCWQKTPNLEEKSLILSIFAKLSLPTAQRLSSPIFPCLFVRSSLSRLVTPPLISTRPCKPYIFRCASIS